MDWVAKYIMEMKDQGCTRIACMGMKLFATLELLPWV